MYTKEIDYSEYIKHQSDIQTQVIQIKTTIMAVHVTYNIASNVQRISSRTLSCDRKFPFKNVLKYITCTKQSSFSIGFGP